MQQSKRENGGLDQGGSNGNGKKVLNFKYILRSIINSICYDWLWSVRERGIRYGFKQLEIWNWHTLRRGRLGGVGFREEIMSSVLEY